MPESQQQGALPTLVALGPIATAGRSEGTVGSDDVAPADGAGEFLFEVRVGPNQAVVSSRDVSVAISASVSRKRW